MAASVISESDGSVRAASGRAALGIGASNPPCHAGFGNMRLQRIHMAPWAKLRTGRYLCLLERENTVIIKAKAWEFTSSCTSLIALRTKCQECLCQCFYLLMLTFKSFGSRVSKKFFLNYARPLRGLETNCDKFILPRFFHKRF